MALLANSTAADVWCFFEKICAIPHGSGHEAALLGWIQNWAADKGFETVQDSTGNLVVKAPGTAGYENSPVLMMQSHVDMVCEKNSDVEHNFETDGIRTVCEGDWLRADGTTLGADNGIGVAMMLALLNKDCPHPPIEAVFTVDEEIGLVGASAFDMSLVSGKRFINLDTEEEGVFIASNAGGRHGKMSLPTEWEKPENMQFLSLKLNGLQGGHSGMDINKGRGNAIRLLSRVLCALRESVPGFVLGDMQAGSKENAIPREAVCTVGIEARQVEPVQDIIRVCAAVFQSELAASDAGVKLVCEACKAPERVLSKKTRDKLLLALALMPNGVQTMSCDIEGLVQSSNNLGVVKTDEDNIQILYTIRSSVKSLKEAIYGQIVLLQNHIGAVGDVMSDYPAWEYQPVSELREVFRREFLKIEGKEPVITAVHCGLECGIFSDAMEGLDVISLGPELCDVHSPSERVSISSTERTWTLLKAAVAQLR